MANYEFVQVVGIIACGLVPICILAFAPKDITAKEVAEYEDIAA